MQYWLMKSEPDVWSIDQQKKAGSRGAPWDGVRNYQARNFMRDDMALGDLAFFYQSNCDTPGIVGIMEITKLAYPDPLQFQEGNKYFDPKSSPNNPRWLNVDVTLVRKLPLIELKTLRLFSELEEMMILRKGNRLSITPITKDEWLFINNIKS